MKVCTNCNVEKPLTDFRRRKHKDIPKKPSDSQMYRNTCRVCEAEPRRIEKQIYRQKLKNDILSEYGSKCVCCGETTTEFLTLDHVFGGGNMHRKSGGHRGVYVDVRRQGYPADYQILCWNCNCGRAVNKGVCPHKEHKTIVDEYIEMNSGALP